MFFVNLYVNLYLYLYIHISLASLPKMYAAQYNRQQTSLGPRIADMWIAQLPTDYNIGHSHCMFDKDVTAYFLLV